MQFASFHGPRGEMYQIAGDGLGFSLNPIKAVKKGVHAVEHGVSYVSSAVSHAFSPSSLSSLFQKALPAVKTVAKTAVLPVVKLNEEVAKAAYQGVQAAVKPICKLATSSGGTVIAAGAASAPDPRAQAVGTGISTVAAACGGGGAPLIPGASSVPPIPLAPAPPAPSYYPPTVIERPFFRSDNPVLWLLGVGVAAGGVYYATR